MTDIQAKVEGLRQTGLGEALREACLAFALSTSMADVRRAVVCASCNPRDADGWVSIRQKADLSLK
jgi:hypothetical protein